MAAQLESETGVAFDPKVWAYENFSTDANGHVEGSAYTHTFADGHDVQITVTSYDFERRGETKTNHVPNVVVSDADGVIVAEPEARDDSNARQAIENAVGTAEYAVTSPRQFGIGGGA